MWSCNAQRSVGKNGHHHQSAFTIEMAGIGGMFAVSSDFISEH